MAQQLPLPTTGRLLAVVRDHPEVVLEIPAADWRIDERTKAVGRAGLAEARRALADARARSAA